MRVQCTQQEMFTFLGNYKDLGEAMVSKIAKGIDSDNPYSVYVKTLNGNQLELCGHNETQGTFFIHSEHMAKVEEADRCSTATCKAVITAKEGFVLNDELYCNTCIIEALKKLQKGKRFNFEDFIADSLMAVSE